MLDRHAMRLLRPGLERGAQGLHRLGVRADQVTLAGFAIGIVAAAAIATGWPVMGLVLLLASRLCDGLDGTLARLTAPTERGGFLDITFPPANALAAAALLAAFVGTASSFLAFAALAARRGLTSLAYPNKGIYYLGGLTEATETLACFALMCLWPARFATIAWTFGVLCALTIVMRLWAGWRTFST